MLRALAPLIYLGLVHIAAMLHQPVLGLAGLAAVGGLTVLANCRNGGPRAERLIWTLLGAAAAALAAGVVCGYPGLAQAVTLPPVALNLFMLAVFGRTLLPGREPLITRLCRLERIALGLEVPPDLAAYTRRLTVLWVLLFAALAALSAWAAAFADLVLWSWIANIAAPAASITLFLGEHVWRSLRYPAHGPASPLRTLRTMLRPDAWVTP